MTNATSKTIYVVDGTAQLHRSYHARSESRPGPESALLGLDGSLRRLIRRFDARYVAVVFDAHQPTHRHEIDPKYKANRPTAPDDLMRQLLAGPDRCRDAGYATFRSVGYEADDLMATLAARARRAGIATSLVTPDKDVFSLIDATTSVLDPATLEAVESNAVRAKFGVPPERIGDYLALCGDSTDNVPGAPGVGPKTARTLLQRFDGLDDLGRRLGEVAGLDGLRGAKRLAERLQDSWDDVLVSRRLVTLVEDAPLDPEPTSLRDFAAPAETHARQTA